VAGAGVGAVFGRLQGEQDNEAIDNLFAEFSDRRADELRRRAAQVVGRSIREVRLIACCSHLGVGLCSGGCKCGSATCWVGRVVLCAAPDGPVQPCPHHPRSKRP